jgi:hypothetical protein
VGGNYQSHQQCQEAVDELAGGKHGYDDVVALHGEVLPEDGTHTGLHDSVLKEGHTSHARMQQTMQVTAHTLTTAGTARE